MRPYVRHGKPVAACASGRGTPSLWEGLAWVAAVGSICHGVAQDGAERTGFQGRKLRSTEQGCWLETCFDQALCPSAAPTPSGSSLAVLPSFKALVAALTSHRAPLVPTAFSWMGVAGRAWALATRAAELRAPALKAP